MTSAISVRSSSRAVTRSLSRPPTAAAGSCAMRASAWRSSAVSGSGRRRSSSRRSRSSAVSACSSRASSVRATSRCSGSVELAPRPLGLERARSSATTSTPPPWIDRLVRHAEILNLKGDSYRLKDKDLGSPPPAKTPESGNEPPAATSPRASERPRTRHPRRGAPKSVDQDRSRAQRHRGLDRWTRARVLRCGSRRPRARTPLCRSSAQAPPEARRAG
jgi:hypothetical protein